MKKITEIPKKIFSIRVGKYRLVLYKQIEKIINDLSA